MVRTGLPVSRSFHCLRVLVCGCPWLALCETLCGVMFKAQYKTDDTRHKNKKQEGRTTTRTTITRQKGKEAKRNGSKPERCSSCVLWGGGAAPSPPCPPPALGNLCGVMFKAQYKTDDTRHKNKKEEGRTTTRTTITRHKGKEAKRNGSKPERCSSCVLWGGGAAPSPPMPPTSRKKFMWGNV